MNPCDCRNCDILPCPCPLATVLDEWSGNKDFSNNRDITQMPGWTAALERNRDSGVLGYLWRIVGRDYQLNNWTIGEEGGLVDSGAPLPDGSIVAIGPVRDFKLYGSCFSGLLYTLGTEGIQRSGICTTPTTMIPQFREGFSGVNEWAWKGHFDVSNGAGIPLIDLATYQLQLGVIRCDCENGLHITWPKANPESTPTGLRLLPIVDDGFNDVGVQVRPKRQYLRLPGSPIGGKFGLHVGPCLADNIYEAPEYTFDITSTAENIEAWLKAQSYLGISLSGVTCSDGPLPNEGITITMPVGINLCVVGDFSKLRYTMVGLESRRMTPCEEDARAWCGDIFDPSIPHSCNVEALSDGVDMRHIFKRFGRISSSRSHWCRSLGEPAESGQIVGGSFGHRQLEFSQLGNAKLMILQASAYNTDVSNYSDYMAMLSMLNDWLDIGGKTLVLNGAIIAEPSDGPGTRWCFGNARMSIPDSRVNTLLGGVGSGMSVQSMWNIPPEREIIDESLEAVSSPISWGLMTLTGSFGDGDITRTTTLVPANSGHSLDLGASTVSQISAVSENEGTGGGSLEHQVKYSRPGYGLLVISGGTPLLMWESIEYEDSFGAVMSASSPFAALAVDDLANGSRVILSGSPGCVDIDPILVYRSSERMRRIGLIELLPSAWLNSWMMS